MTENIRKARPDDFDEIMAIYAFARGQMRKNGNPDQWGDTYPLPEDIEQNIKDQKLYVIEEEGILQGVFFFTLAPDPTYAKIYQGAWLNDAPYGTLHKVASAGKRKGVVSDIVAYACSQIPNIRIDTHRDNLIMQHVLEKNGFTKCGIIYLENGDERIAYHKD